MPGKTQHGAKQPKAQTKQAQELTAELEATMVRGILEAEFRMTKGETQRLRRAAEKTPLRQWVKQELLRAAARGRAPAKNSDKA